jgi:hypothetical protein
VYGLRLAELYSGQALYCLHGGGQGSREKEQGHIVVYGASSLGVIHDLVTNTQLFFDKHDDELTCITVDPSCNYVLSGQLGQSVSQGVSQAVIWSLYVSCILLLIHYAIDTHCLFIITCIVLYCIVLYCVVCIVLYCFYQCMHGVYKLVII